MLTSCDVGSLSVGSLCGRAGGQNIAVACLSFDPTARRTRDDNKSRKVPDELEQKARRDIYGKDAGFGSVLGAGENNIKTEVPPPRVELETNWLAKHYSQVRYQYPNLTLDD